MGPTATFLRVAVAVAHLVVGLLLVLVANSDSATFIGIAFLAHFGTEVLSEARYSRRWMVTRGYVGYALALLLIVLGLGPIGAIAAPAGLALVVFGLLAAAVVHRAPHRGLARRAPRRRDAHAPARGRPSRSSARRWRCSCSASSPPTWRSSSWAWWPWSRWWPRTATRACCSCSAWSPWCGRWRPATDDGCPRRCSPEPDDERDRRLRRLVHLRRGGRASSSRAPTRPTRSRATSAGARRPPTR